jgi:hypothetical protein
MSRSRQKSTVVKIAGRSAKAFKKMAHRRKRRWEKMTGEEANKRQFGNPWLSPVEKMKINRASDTRWKRLMRK